MEVAARTLPASSQSWRKNSSSLWFLRLSECDPNRQLDVSGSKRHSAAGFEQLTKPATTLEFTPAEVRHNVRHGLANGNAPSAVNSRWLIPGISAATLVVAVALAAFSPCGGTRRRVTGWQSGRTASVACGALLLLAGVSLGAALFVPAIFLARALYRRRFPGRQCCCVCAQ